MVGLGFLMLGLGLFSLWVALARRALSVAAAAPVRGRDGPGGLHRRARGLDHDRDRTPAVHGLWAAAHG